MESRHLGKGFVRFRELYLHAHVNRVAGRDLTVKFDPRLYSFTSRRPVGDGRFRPGALGMAALDRLATSSVRWVPRASVNAHTGSRRDAFSACPPERRFLPRR